MEYTGRIILFLSVLFSSACCYSQLIEKAAPPVKVYSAPLDSFQNGIIVSDIIISGFKRTRPYIIQREVPFKKGDTIPAAQVQEKLDLCRQQLMNTALFVDVEIEFFAQGGDHVFIIIHVKERWYLFPLPYFRIMSRNFNTWWVQERHSLQRVEYGIKFMQNNVTGRNDNLSVWLISGFTQQFSFRYENPFLDRKLKHGLNIGFKSSRNRELNYGIDHNRQQFFRQPDRFLIQQVHADLAYLYRPAIKSRHNFKVAYTHLKINDTVVKLNPTYLGNSLSRLKYFDVSYNFQYFNVDYIPYPVKGVTAEVGFNKRFGKNANIWHFYGRTNYSLPLLRRTFLQLQAVGDLKVPFRQPYISNVLLGPADLYMRGLEYYVVEGTAGGVARATLKQQIFALQVNNPVKSKTHNKIPFRILLKTYGDLGYAYSPQYGNSIFNNKFLHSWGLGVDVVTVYDVVLKFEYSFNQLGGRGLFFHTQNDF